MVFAWVSSKIFHSYAGEFSRFNTDSSSHYILSPLVLLFHSRTAAALLNIPVVSSWFRQLFVSRLLHFSSDLKISPLPCLSLQSCFFTSHHTYQNKRLAFVSEMWLLRSPARSEHDSEREPSHSQQNAARFLPKHSLWAGRAAPCASVTQQEAPQRDAEKQDKTPKM